MSGLLKVIFDRITDCLKIEKSIGGKLNRKSIAVISCGSDNEQNESFFLPFEKSETYLDMNYIGHIHTRLESNEIPPEVEMKINELASILNNA